MTRPIDLASHGDPDGATLAAAYAHALVSNCGFVDADKRVVWVTARLFLITNGWNSAFDPFEAIRIVEAASAGRISEEDVAGWFRYRTET